MIWPIRYLKEYQENYFFHLICLVRGLRVIICSSYWALVAHYFNGQCILLILVEMLIFYLAQCGMWRLLCGIGIYGLHVED